MRSVYTMALKYIEMESKRLKEEDVVRFTSDTMMRTAYGMNLSEREKEDLISLDVNELQDRLRNILRDKKAGILNKGNRQKAIPEVDLESYLSSGWELVHMYPRGDKAVVRLP